MSSPYSTAELEYVFGPESSGATPEARARTSTREYVRSQVQLALHSEGATGHRLTAEQALTTFGFKNLVRVAADGGVPLIGDASEPAATILDARAALNLTQQQLARAAGLAIDAVKKAETPGAVSPIRVLERIAQKLGLDERLLGYEKTAGRDLSLGVRLRELSTGTDSAHFSPTIVCELAEAAWVVARQINLNRLVGLSGHPKMGIQLKDSNYAYPAYEKGYALAEKTRLLLGIDSIAPISSLRSLIEEVLNIPLVQGDLGERFAGATIANGSSRGIVINEHGMNQNVWVRRMTAAHELAHLLWDPDQRLNKLRVDAYADLERGHFEKKDPVEMRANAFAIGFLAPREGVRSISKRVTGVQKIVETVMTHYGISATAAKWHVKNICKLETQQVRILPTPSDEWVIAENLSVDFIPIKQVPITRRGKFALVVARAFKLRRITADSAAIFLGCSREAFEENVDGLISVLTPATDSASAI